MDFQIRRVPANETWELRQQILRPHQAVEAMALIDDDLSTTATFAAIDENDDVVGTARVAIADVAPPLVSFVPSDALTWQLRGMATRADLRNVGLGKQVLDAVIRHVGENGVGFLWCNARVLALSFYQRASFVEHGDVWIEPEIGPHVLMWRLVERKDA
jgi:predicted GNAT family N-acyltransferase